MTKFQRKLWVYRRVIIMLVAGILCIVIIIGALDTRKKFTIPVFTKEYLIRSYPVAGEDRYIYIIEYSFDDVEDAVEFLATYEELRGNYGKK
jgi:hypothetical protein